MWLQPSTQTLPFTDVEVCPVAVVGVPLLIGVHHYTGVVGELRVPPVTEVTWADIEPYIGLHS